MEKRGNGMQKKVINLLSSLYQQFELVSLNQQIEAGSETYILYDYSCPIYIFLDLIIWFHTIQLQE